MSLHETESGAFDFLRRAGATRAGDEVLVGPHPRADAEGEGAQPSRDGDEEVVTKSFSLPVQVIMDFKVTLLEEGPHEGRRAGSEVLRDLIDLWLSCPEMLDGRELSDMGDSGQRASTSFLLRADQLRDLKLACPRESMRRLEQGLIDRPRSVSVSSVVRDLMRVWVAKPDILRYM
jgi:hypothetical protein